MNASPRCLLLHPPFTDPTTPYHSLSYLVGHAAAAGFSEIECHDLNIACLNELTKSTHVRALLLHCRQLVHTIEDNFRRYGAPPTNEEQVAYRLCLEAYDLCPEELEAATSVFRDPAVFFDYQTYSRAVKSVKRWLNLLSVNGIPGQFDGFSLRFNGAANLCSSFDLSDQRYLSRVNAPFDPAYQRLLPDLLRQNRFDLIGFSVSYLGQLPFALRLMQLCAEFAPDAVIIAGGTEVSDVVKYANDDAVIWRTFARCDAIVVGEGENAFVEIMRAMSNGSRLVSGDGVWCNPRGRLRTNAALRSTRFENLNVIASPSYDLWDYKQYWAPYPMVLYSPTRGCYWNRCTFCDYGLNGDSPTSPSRERAIHRVIEDLKRIADITPYVYLAVDAISPRYLRRLCDAIIEEGLDVRWAAEIRLEKAIADSDLAEVLSSSGMVAASFGFESACQRILNLIDKGIDIGRVASVLRSLVENHIGVQLMGFIGFPTETPEEAKATFDFLFMNPELWAIAAIGDFSLTAGSIVAKRPSQFGISSVEVAPGDDITRILLWTDAEGYFHTGDASRSDIVMELSEAILKIRDDRPWVGGVDSAHSIFYFERFGPAFFRGHHAGNSGTCLEYTSPFLDFAEFKSTEDLQTERRLRRRERRAFRFDDYIVWAKTCDSALARCGHLIIQIFPGGLLEKPPIEQDGPISESYLFVKEMLLAHHSYV
jgi:anaerobic magnesium-protoporphyrin IX monomethyl ester cyclase